MQGSLLGPAKRVFGQEHQTLSSISAAYNLFSSSGALILTKDNGADIVRSPLPRYTWSCLSEGRREKTFALLNVPWPDDVISIEDYHPLLCVTHAAGLLMSCVSDGSGPPRDGSRSLTAGWRTRLTCPHHLTEHAYSRSCTTVSFFMCCNTRSMSSYVLTGITIEPLAAIPFAIAPNL